MTSSVSITIVREQTVVTVADIDESSRDVTFEAKIMFRYRTNDKKRLGYTIGEHSPISTVICLIKQGSLQSCWQCRKRS